MNLDDRSFMRILYIVVAALVGLLLTSILLANLIGGSSKKEMAEIQAKKDTAMLASAGETADPKLVIVVSEGSATEVAVAPRGGEDVYSQSCAACHAAGVSGAPKPEKADWEPRLEKGYDQILSHAINGVPNTAMAAKGGSINLQDQEVANAVIYMLTTAGITDFAPAEIITLESTEESEVKAQEADSESSADTNSVSADSAASEQKAEIKNDTVTETIVSDDDTEEVAETSVAAEADHARGQEVYTARCAVCHDTGVSGAPKPGSDEFAPRVEARGYDGLVNSGINGLADTAMMAKGGAADLSDEDVTAAVAYMLSESGITNSAVTPETNTTEATAQEQPSDADTVETEVQQTEEDAADSQSNEETQVTEVVEGQVANVKVSDIVTETATEASEVVTEAAEIEVNTVTSSATEATNAGYQKVCAICHDGGLAGAPKLGDQAAWAERLVKGRETLLENAINGLNGMPPRGGVPTSLLDDAGLEAAVNYMISQAQ